LQPNLVNLNSFSHLNYRIDFHKDRRLRVLPNLHFQKKLKRVKSAIKFRNFVLVPTSFDPADQKWASSEHGEIHFFY